MITSAHIIPDYGLTAPVVDETLAKLTKSLGASKAAELWAGCCAKAGIPKKIQYSPDELLAVGLVLAKTPGIAGVYGNGLAVRARSFRLLSNRAAPVA